MSVPPLGRGGGGGAGPEGFAAACSVLTDFEAFALIIFLMM